MCLVLMFNMFNEALCKKERADLNFRHIEQRNKHPLDLTMLTCQKLQTKPFHVN